ncbi:MAG: hypothetical protein ABI091_26520 [Ferruginibacter sp.]
MELGKKYLYNGKSKTIAEWVAYTGITKSTIYSRLYRGKTFREAIGYPPKVVGKKRRYGLDFTNYIYTYKDGYYSKEPGTDENSIEILPEICSYFGCRKELNMNEKLCGTRCCDHPIEKPKTYFNPLL